LRNTVLVLVLTLDTADALDHYVGHMQRYKERKARDSQISQRDRYVETALLIDMFPDLQSNKAS